MTEDTILTQMPTFPETADIESSSDEYAARFAGATGHWMLGIQKQIVLDLLRQTPDATVLDVGGGHGQLAIPLVKHGFDVTVLSSSDSCKERIQEIVDSGTCKFQVGNVLELPFEDKSFDTVICFRMVTHCHEWRKLISELCRVAKRAVIVDYPTRQGLNTLSPMLFAAKKRIEKNTRQWHPFRHEEITEAFRESSFERNHRRPQYFLPMVVHRILHCRPLSAAFESIFERIGFTKRWGTPVIVDMRPADKSN